VQFNDISQRVWRGNWFEHYREIDNIEFALQRISSRRPRVAPLSDTFNTLSDNYQKLSATFFDLYPEVLAAAREETKKETN
jgi:acyl carrier protein phosphodiesterase